MALVPCSTLQGAQYEKQFGAGALRLCPENPNTPENLFKVENNVIESRLANTLHLTLSIEGKAPLKVAEDALTQALKALKDSGLCYPADLKIAGPPKLTPLPDGRKRWEGTLIFSMIPPKESIVELSLPATKYTEGAEATAKSVDWPALKLRITTDVSALDDVKKELRDITPPEEPPSPPPSWTRWLRWAGIAAAALGLLAGAWGLRHRFTGPARPLAPHEWAVRELDRIEAMHLPESAEVDRYHTLLSDVIRLYLERRFDLPASQQTTAEFLDTMHRSPQLTVAQQQLLRDFLSRCDMAKFARAAPPPEECRAVADMARSFVQETTPRPASPSSTDPRNAP
jgi:hypothetical protein